MFPTSPSAGSITIPSDATFWMPKPEDIDVDGIGAFFDDTWLIKDVPVREARRLRQEERRIAEVVGHLATTAEDFDRLAHAVEDGYEPDEPDGGYDLTATERAKLGEFLPENEDEGTALDSLELGVAGLVYALATVRIIPAASCRGIQVLGPGPMCQSYCSRRQNIALGLYNHSLKLPAAGSASTQPGRTCLPLRDGRYSTRWP